ncbi:MAG: hypothetical protein R3C52_10835 [Hyphomonadaceae bacterium]
MSLRRGVLLYLVVVAAILLLLAQCKPSEGELKDQVHSAVHAYAAARAGRVDDMVAAADHLNGEAADPEHERVDAALLHGRMTDWLLARSYAVDFDGVTFSCWGVANVAICFTPDGESDSDDD